MTITPGKYAFLLLLFFMKKADGQNLLANGSFEDLNTCTEFHANCSPAAWFTVMPANASHLPAKVGNRSLTFYFDNLYTPVIRAFPYTKLLCPVKAGNEYKLKLWLNSGKYPFTHLDILFTYKDPARIKTRYGSFESTFQFDESNIIQRDKDGWILLSKQFTPKEEYRFILIGNLSNNTEYAELKKRTSESSGDIIYRIDDISLTATDSTLDSCPRYNEIVKQLYGETRRHTAYMYLDEEKAPVIKERSLSYNTPVTDTPTLKSDTLVLPGVLFKTNKSEIDTAYRALLDNVIEKIKEKKVSSMNINGYTDNTGTDEFNKTLSVKRAEAVGNYLADHLPQIKEKIIENGYGSEHPVAPNNSTANKTKNRRVEIILHYLYLSQ